MADADGTYPFRELPAFVHRLEQDADLVIGSRFKGTIHGGAMPWLNRFVGNPLLTGMLNLLFGVKVSDAHCGMRALRRDALPVLDLHATGMEFASEMVFKAYRRDLRVSEIPIDYYPRVGESKLMPFRNGWRHVEYMLVFSPAMVFLVPGLLLAGLGMLVQLLLVAGPRELLFRTWDVHTNLAGLSMVLTGSTLAVLGLIGAHYAWTTGMQFRHSPIARTVAAAGDKPLRWIGAALAGAGALIWAATIPPWVASGLGLPPGGLSSGLWRWAGW